MTKPTAAQWAKRIAEAQEDTHETIGGKRYARVPYGNEFERCGETCRDCGVQKGQLHVVTCCIERCPCCGDQAIGCGCGEAGEYQTQ